MTRREALLQALLGASAVGLRAAVSGLPAAWLLDPRRALAAAAEEAPAPAQFLLLSTSQLGDPVNANAPGTYDDARILHPQQDTMQPTDFWLNGRPVRAARPWSLLSQGHLDRTCFFHHATNTVIHPDEGKVMGLMGAVRHQEMFVSLVAKHLAPRLGTVQREPVALGAATAGEALAFEGHYQPILRPSSLRSTLAALGDPLRALQSHRDRDIDAMNAWFRAEGTSAQRAFVDRYARSRQQARHVSQELLHTLDGLNNDGPRAQIDAAIVLMRMRLTPVITVHIPFGGDNHQDRNLAMEARETVSGVSTLAYLCDSLRSAGLQDQVTFAMLNVFGRTLGARARGSHGRDHLYSHHVGVLTGAQVRGGVVGAVEKSEEDFAATAIDSATGLGAADGDIPYDDTLAAFGKTLGASLGVPRALLDREILGGRVVEAAVQS